MNPSAESSRQLSAGHRPRGSDKTDAEADLATSLAFTLSARRPPARGDVEADRQMCRAQLGEPGLAYDRDAFVETVAGPVSPDDLGPTLMHEHLVVDWDLAFSRPSAVDSAEALEAIVSSCKEAQRGGIGCLVDVGTEQFGPSSDLLAAITHAVPLHVVCAIGVFCTDTMPAPHWTYPPATSSDIPRRFIETVGRGRGTNGVRPGIIKVGTSSRAITGLEETVLRAAAITQRETGLTITTHTEHGRHALEQIEILADAAANLERVVVGHVGWGEDPDSCRRLADRGVSLGFDTIGYSDHSVEEWVILLEEMLQHGFARQMVLSHDQAIYARGIAGIFDEEELTGDLTVIPAQVLPELRARGVDLTTIEQIMVHNPARLLAIDASFKGLFVTPGILADNQYGDGDLGVSDR